ncbi:MAG: succinate--CoA ligase subunit alpha [Elusimicrobia bacterium CG_4_9_14_3_um_filter_62_55]|nr:MAG: succinate--CoA ligase subunit alpha [Elusimicrobia bacterium CG_4_10_14_0_2_um_filter_63_34]PJB26440.1 MAG: succinate--CoA ligase subunit alpha [Elusimicrobia bacterium CG_4_9_14_3_um_filter_62_55]
MSILLNKKSRIVVQGITGSAGSFHSEQCLKYGKGIVAGATPGKGGKKHLGVPVFNTVHDAVSAEAVDASLIFVPPPFAADAMLEAADAGVKLIITITEGIPVLDMARVKKDIERRRALGQEIRLVGPNCPGVITPGEVKAGIMPGYIHKGGGPVGLVSRSGTLTYEAVWQLTQRGIGQSTVVGIGGDPIAGSTHTDILRLFEQDDATKAVVLIGEIGGSAEEEAADFYKRHMSKPVYAFIAGKTAPPGRRMGHAGAIIEGGSGGHADKIAALKQVGIHVVDNLSEIGETVARTISAAQTA